jgi:putative ABC transport system permease protein
MFDLDKWQEILATMQKNKLRTILTAFGVFWGIFMLVILLGAGNGMQKGVEKEFADEAKNSLWIWNGTTSLPFKGMKPGREIIFTNDDYQSVEKQIEGISGVAARTAFWGEYTMSYGKKNGSYSVFGTNLNYLKINGSKMAAGRNIDPMDVQEKRKVIVIGKRVKDVMFGVDTPPEQVIGKYLKINVLKEKVTGVKSGLSAADSIEQVKNRRPTGFYFEVVGVFTNKGEQGRLEERSVMPISTMQSTFNLYNKVHTLALTTQPGVRVSEVQQKLKILLASKHQYDPKDEEAIGMNNNEEGYERFQGLFNGIATFVWGIGILTLIAGIIGVSNIMLIIVKERTKEIGIRKALGATPGSIVSQVIQESVVITFVAGYLGLLAGMGVLELIGLVIKQSNDSIRYFTYPTINLNVVFAAVLLLVIAGALAGLFPALKAANVKPVEALRAD